MQWIYGTGTAFPVLAILLTLLMLTHGRRRLAAQSETC